MRALTIIFSFHRREEPIMYIKVQIFIFFACIYAFSMLSIALNGLFPTIVFKALAEQYELDLVFVKNSHEFVHEYLKRPEYVEMMRRLGALGDGNQDQSTLSPDEWEVAYLYMSFVLRPVICLAGLSAKTEATHTFQLKAKNDNNRRR